MPFGKLRKDGLGIIPFSLLKVFDSVVRRRSDSHGHLGLRLVLPEIDTDSRANSGGSPSVSQLPSLSCSSPSSFDGSPDLFTLGVVIRELNANTSYDGQVRGAVEAPVKVQQFQNFHVSSDLGALSELGGQAFPAYQFR